MQTKFDGGSRRFRRGSLAGPQWQSGVGANFAMRMCWDYRREDFAKVRRGDEFGIYAVGTGRICVAALNQGNLEYVAKAVATVSRG